MSVPVLLSILDSDANSSSNIVPTPTDEHIQNCASYVEAAAVLAPAAANEAAVIEATSDAAAACTPQLRAFTVQLNADLGPNEFVGLTGDTKALGNWQLEHAVNLKSNGAGAWTTNVLLPSCPSVSYRYFIYAEDTQKQKQIRRWETSFQPRQLLQCNTNCAQVDLFGELASGNTQVNRGWLTNESLLQLKFEREQMFQVIDVDKFDPENVTMKLVPIAASETSANNGVSVDVAKLKYGESRLHTQSAEGVTYTRGDVVIFHVTLPLKSTLSAYELEFYTPEHVLIGRANIAADALTGSEGVLELNVTAPENNATTIAQLTLPYLIVKPFTDTTLDFRTTYAHYWPKSWPNLDVGHRGNGRSYLADPPPERENTIASFLRAYERFADMIELDVHLTADGVPIIYHDFGVRSAPQGKEITSPAQLQYVLIKDLTYDALKRLRVFSVINNKAVEYPSYNAESRPEHRIFPTLIDILEGLPKTLGIDVEIKWPQRKIGGGVEARQTIDKNFFVNRVLATIITHGCGRPLVFSSFDADICTMLRFKQNIFPVMFLTMGETKKWEQFLDLRTRNFEQALNNAQAFELAGTAPHAEDFLGSNGADMMQQAHNLGQITLVWGDDCNSKERVKYFSDIGATATCYDRADLYVPEGKQRAFFNSTSLIAEFEGQCR